MLGGAGLGQGLRVAPGGDRVAGQGLGRKLPEQDQGSVGFPGLEPEAGFQVERRRQVGDGGPRFLTRRQGDVPPPGGERRLGLWLRVAL